MFTHSGRLIPSILGALVAGTALAACGSVTVNPSATGTTGGSGTPIHLSTPPGSSTTTTSGTPKSTPTTLECSFTAVSGEDSAGRNPGLPPQPAPGPDVATFTTSAGTFVITLNAAKAPCTTSSFRHLAQVGFFNNTHCHRLTTSGIYVLQCGDPTGTGTGGPGYTIPDENLTGATYPAGTVAIANTGQPHTGGSQFFIVYKNGSSLAPTYTPFGTVTSGLSVIQKVAAGGSNNANGPGDGAPNIPVNIKTVKMS